MNKNQAYQMMKKKYQHPRLTMVSINEERPLLTLSLDTEKAGNGNGNTKWGRPIQNEEDWEEQ